MAVVPAGSNLDRLARLEKGRGKDEGPQQAIAIRVPFAVGRSEVAFKEWLACVAEGGCNAYRPGDYEWGYDTRPVINVSWNDAKAYVEWLSQEGRRDLPAAVRGGVGIRRARLREGVRGDAVLVRQRHFQGTCELRLALCL